MIADARGLRVLWLSPWMRPLARVYAEELRTAGAEVLLVTSDQHPSSDAARDYELVLDPRPKTLRTWPEFATAAAHIRRFAPNVAVTEIVRDPRWTAFAVGVPRVELVHDDRPHDEGETRPRWERALFGRWARKSACTMCFSRYVAEAVGTATHIPLTSDLEESEVPPFVTADARKNFVLLGRLNDYKNIDVCLKAWEMHARGDNFRGDTLLLFGDGQHLAPLPQHVRRHSGPYRYGDVLPDLARAKASIVHYRRASQSGVQVLSMQLGVTPIVSPEGALPEFQPPGESAIAVDDVEGLAARFDELADPHQAADRGAAARAHYVDTFSGGVSAGALVEHLRRLSQTR